MPKFRPNELKHWVTECKKGRHPTNFSPPDLYGNLYFKFNVVFPDNQFISEDDDVKVTIVKWVVSFKGVAILLTWCGCCDCTQCYPNNLAHSQKTMLRRIRISV